MLNPNLNSKLKFNLRKRVKNQFSIIVWADSKILFTPEIVKSFYVCPVKIRSIQSLGASLRNFAKNRSFCSLSPPSEKFENPNPYILVPKVWRTVATDAQF